MPVLEKNLKFTSEEMGIKLGKDLVVDLLAH